MFKRLCFLSALSYLVFTVPGCPTEDPNPDPEMASLEEVARTLVSNLSLLDTDNDGFLSFSEAQAGHKDMTQAYMSQMDTNGDGLLSSTELQAANGGEGGGELQPMALKDVKSWGYQITGIDNEAGDSVDKLVASRYDMLVIEPTRTDWTITEDGTLSGSQDFDMKAAVSRLKNSPASDGTHGKLVIAYIDIGEAEDWRWYWDPRVIVREPSENRGECSSFERPVEDWPSWIVGRDPDCFAGNYPVAYWEEAWREIVISGTNLGPAHGTRNFNSIIEETIVDGFDGIYLDWVEGFKDERVIAAAQAAGKDPVEEMLKFIRDMRTYVDSQVTDRRFLIIQQNAADLIFGGDSNREAVYNDSVNEFANVENLLNWELLNHIDAIAQEGVWYDGKAADAWETCDGVDIDMNDGRLEIPTEEYLDDLTTFYKSEGIPVFVCEYAHEHAQQAYTNAFDSQFGFVPYATHRSLSRLTDTPPPSYAGPLEEGTLDCTK